MTEQIEPKNIFELWRENGENLPIFVRKGTWSDAKGHYARIDRIEVKNWPYGIAYGQYFFHGRAGKKGQIDASGTYQWKIVEI